MRKDEITLHEKTPRKKTKRRHAKRRNNDTRKDATRKDETTLREKTKERQAKRRKVEITPREKTKSPTRKDDKLTILNDVFSRGVFRLFVLEFRIFVWRVSLFRLFEWRYFGGKRRKVEMAKNQHHSVSLILCGFVFFNSRRFVLSLSSSLFSYFQSFLLPAT